MMKVKSTASMKSSCSSTLSSPGSLHQQQISETACASPASCETGHNGSVPAVLLSTFSPITSKSGSLRSVQSDTPADAVRIPSFHCTSPTTPLEVHVSSGSSGARSHGKRDSIVYSPPQCLSGGTTPKKKNNATKLEAQTTLSEVCIYDQGTLSPPSFAHVDSSGGGPNSFLTLSQSLDDQHPLGRITSTRTSRTGRAGHPLEDSSMPSSKSDPNLFYFYMSAAPSRRQSASTVSDSTMSMLSGEGVVLSRVEFDAGSHGCTTSKTGTTSTQWPHHEDFLKHNNITEGTAAEKTELLARCDKMLQQYDDASCDHNESDATPHHFAAADDHCPERCALFLTMFR